MTEFGPQESAVLNALPDGVMLIQEGRIEYFNPAAAHLLGVEPPRLLAWLAPSVLVSLVERAATEGRLAEVFKRGNPVRWIQAVAGPASDDAGGIVLVLRDVTQRQRVEAMRRDFLADASHELKTPVASIHAAAETLVRALEEDPDVARHFAQQIQATAGRLSQLVDDLLDLSRVESKPPEFHAVDLVRLIRKESGRVADRAEVEGVDIVLDLQDITVQASRKDLRLAIRNLLDNAIAYTPAGGTVTIATLVREGESVISITDTGVGIPQRDQPRIFERFYRVDDARNRETGGTGLGLAIVRHVAEEHGGTVEVESELGWGSTFRIQIPHNR